MLTIYQGAIFPMCPHSPPYPHPVTHPIPNFIVLQRPLCLSGWVLFYAFALIVKKNTVLIFLNLIVWVVKYLFDCFSVLSYRYLLEVVHCNIRGRISQLHGIFVSTLMDGNERDNIHLHGVVRTTSSLVVLLMKTEDTLHDIGGSNDCVAVSGWSNAVAFPYVEVPI